MKKSLILTNILLGTTILFNGCGGGGGSSATSSSGTTSSISTLFGIVSDGPIKNARVFLDVNNNGVYNEGEPYDITNSKGEYSIPYVLKPGLEYMLIAEGSGGLGTIDELDNVDDNGVPIELNFTMFLDVKADGKADDTIIVGKTYKKDLTPITFKNYLVDLTSSTYINEHIFNIVNTTLTKATEIFQLLILKVQIDNQNDNSAKIVSGTIATSNDVIITAASNSENKYDIPEDVGDLKSLKYSLVTGNTKEKIFGINSLIDSKIAFDIMNSYIGTESVNVNVNGVNKIIKFIKKDDIITAIFKETLSTSIDSAEYEGVVIFNSTFPLTLLHANYTQKHTQISNSKVKNSVSGIIEISNVSSIYNLNLSNGTFTMNAPLYEDEEVKGDVTIKGAITLDSGRTLFNNNTIETTTVILKTKSKPIKKDLYDTTLFGLWSGNLTNSCTISLDTMNLSIPDQNTASWQAQSNGKTYGTELSISDSKVTFKDSFTNNNTTWSVGTILDNRIEGTWNDALNNCTGTYSLSKPQVN